MKKAVIFGAGSNFIYSFTELRRSFDIIGIADNSEQKAGKILFGYEIRPFSEYAMQDFDCVIVTPNDPSAIRKQLISYGVSEEKILSIGEALSCGGSRRLNIAVLLYGGMGDIIIAKNWLYYLDRYYGISKENVYLYSSEGSYGIIRDIFSDCKWINDILTLENEQPETSEGAFDIIFGFCIFPQNRRLNDERVYTINRELYEYCDALRKFGLKYYVPGFFASADFYKTVSSIFDKYPERKYHTHFDVLGNFHAGDEFICDIPVNDDSDYLNELGICRSRFITVDTGANSYYSSKAGTRSWSYENWNELSRSIKRAYPDIPLIQAGLTAGDERNITADLNLQGKTDLEQIKILMKNALLHIDYEGGLIHLRHVLKGGTSVVLMGPTSEKVHNYPENIAVHTDACLPPCEWITQDWLMNCPKGHRFPECLSSVSPKMVMKAVDEFMSSKNKTTGM